MKQTKLYRTGFLVIFVILTVQIALAEDVTFQSGSLNLPNGLVTSGNVGIGTTSPGAKLDFGNTINSRTVALFDNGGTDAWGIEANNNLAGLSGSWYSNVVYGGVDFLWRAKGYADRNTLTTAGTPLMVIKSSGNVGIGTTSPGASRLEVVGTNGIRIGNPFEGTNNRLYFGPNTDSNWYVGENNPSGSNYFIDIAGYFGNGGFTLNSRGIRFIDTSTSAVRMFINDVGNIGIGTTPTNKLDVAGNIGIANTYALVSGESHYTYVQSQRGWTNSGSSNTFWIKLMTVTTTAGNVYGGAHFKGVVYGSDDVQNGEDEIYLRFGRSPGFAGVVAVNRLKKFDSNKISTLRVVRTSANTDPTSTPVTFDVYILLGGGWLNYYQIKWEYDLDKYTVSFTNNEPQITTPPTGQAYSDETAYKIQLVNDGSSIQIGTASIFGSNVGIGTIDTGSYKLYVNGPLAVNSDTANKLGSNTWGALSDVRLKEITGKFDYGLQEVLKLEPIRFHYKPNAELGLASDKEYVGFSAQAVQEIIPEAVRENDKGYLIIEADPILWAMLNAIKEQNKRIEELETRLAEVEATSKK